MDLANARACLAILAGGPAAQLPGLASRLDDAARTGLHEAMLRDKRAHVAGVPGCHAGVALAAHDPAEVMAGLFARGARAAILVDCDTPTLPDGSLEEAVRALESGQIDVVLGPAWDGGVYLIGLRAPAPELLDAIAWGARSVLSQALAAADARGLRVHLLQSCSRVRTPADLDRVRAQLAELSPWSPSYPAATAAHLAALAPSRGETPRDEHWKTRSLRAAYANRWIDVTERVVALPSGHVTLYGVVRTAPCVGVLPFVSPTEVLLVRQFRYVARQFTWEMPTGGVNPDESFEEAARRELREEAGIDADRLVPLLTFDSSKSVVDERGHLFAAYGGRAVEEAGDETEEIERRVFTLEEARRMAFSGEITDAMTLLALLAVRPL